MGHQPVVDHIGHAVHGAACRQQPAGAVGRNAPGDDQADAALGPLGKIRRQLGILVKTVFKPGVHGTHDDAVFQLGKAQIQRFEQVCIGLHGELVVLLWSSKRVQAPALKTTRQTGWPVDP